ncbi:MAG TPA: triphosphoribosyl-dephospho-CoA synthase [Pirellulales bacterium]|nr:triphosphoribosyl-dephospho-CoA synthase [Pirellulales bacterium]
MSFDSAATPRFDSSDDWPQRVARYAGLACLLEVTAPKPGNVHRGADFEGLTFLDFATSALVIGPAMARAAAGARLGLSVRDCVAATRAAVATNTNLGSVLLLVPLAMAPRHESLPAGVKRVLAQLDAEDARLVYEAIRLAQPGGMGRVEEADVTGPAPSDLLHAMRLAADRDLVARQYVNDFADVFDVVVPAIRAGVEADWPLADTIVHAHLTTMARHPDSLIARKCGAPVAAQAAHMAEQVLQAGRPGEQAYHEAASDFDFWLRADGHRRNPGTTADLVTGGLFVALRDAIIEPPLRFYAS